MSQPKRIKSNSYINADDALESATLHCRGRGKKKQIVLCIKTDEKQRVAFFDVADILPDYNDGVDAMNLVRRIHNETNYGATVWKTEASDTDAE